MFSPLFICLVLIQFTAIVTAVPNLSRKCKLSDSECLKTVAGEAWHILTPGIPELGTEPLDEMYIDKNKVDLAGLNLDMTDAHVKGLKDAVIKNVKFDTAKNILKLSYTTDIEMKSKYKASGQLLVLPISGDGDLSINLKNAHIDLMMPYQLSKDKDGQDVLDLKSYQFKYDVKGGAHCDLTNLFNGNKELSTNLLTFMNDNWKILSEEFGRPMFEKVQKKIFEAMKTYLKSQPFQNFVEM